VHRGKAIQTRPDQTISQPPTKKKKKKERKKEKGKRGKEKKKEEKEKKEKKRKEKNEAIVTSIPNIPSPQVPNTKHQIPVPNPIYPYTHVSRHSRKSHKFMCISLCILVT
jgi:seryl-tRNA synthetase